MMPVLLEGNYTHHQCQIGSLLTSRKYFLFCNWTWISWHIFVFFSFLLTKEHMSSMSSYVPASPWYYLWHRMHILPREPGTALWEGGKGLPGNCHSRVRHPGWAPLFAGLHFFLFLIFLPFRWRTSRYFLSKGAKEVDFLGSCLSEKVFILTLLLTV